MFIKILEKNKQMIRIIGAGPAGNYTASLLAPHFPVEVHEEHKIIGDPIQCTGILTANLHNIISIKKNFLVNTIKRVEVYSKNEEAHFKLQEPNYVVNRTLFDTHLADLARQAGAG